MLAAVRSAAVLGVDAFDVTVEVDTARGLPIWIIVGMAAGSVKESRERVTAALTNAGIDLPQRRVTVNLAPADVAKTGTAFDLPIAVAVLVAYGIVEPWRLNNTLFLGELGLDGTLRPVRGVLSVARSLATSGVPVTLVLPPANVAEASLVRDLRLCAPSCITELLNWLKKGELPLAHRAADVTAATGTTDFSDVVGQESAKRALEIAAAGGHNVLLMGPPGAGKTMLARRLPSILPALTERESLEVTAIHSVAGLLNGPSIVPGRPFRAPHHSVSTAGLIGGGSSPRPGEVSLAHHGVLFLDELLEFPRHTLEALRQPLEDGKVTIARALRAVSYPARFTLVAAMNPCPCGFLGDATRPCVCSVAEIHRYRARLSGPLLDRIDLHLSLTPVPRRLLGSGNTGNEGSDSVRARVEAARERQRMRYGRIDAHITSNAEATGRMVLPRLQRDARELLDGAAESLSLSARAYHRVVKVACTIGDLDASDAVTVAHVAEALRYRPVACAISASTQSPADTPAQPSPRDTPPTARPRRGRRDAAADAPPGPH